LVSWHHICCCQTLSCLSYWSNESCLNGPTAPGAIQSVPRHATSWAEAGWNIENLSQNDLSHIPWCLMSWHHICYCKTLPCLSYGSNESCLNGPTAPGGQSVPNLETSIAEMQRWYIWHCRICHVMSNHWLCDKPLLKGLELLFFLFVLLIEPHIPSSLDVSL
jgi:hypothetical protein